MCFYISRENPKAKISTEDIKCYKLLKKKERRISFLGIFTRIKHKLVSPFEEFEYIIGKIYIAAFGIEQSWINDRTINEGLHSYSELAEAREKSYSGIGIYEAVIPAGSEYYYNEYYKQYVSTALKVVKKV